MLQVYRYAMAHNQSFKFIYTLMSIFSAASQLIEKDKCSIDKPEYTLSSL